MQDSCIIRRLEQEKAGKVLEILKNEKTGHNQLFTRHGQRQMAERVRGPGILV